MNNQNQNSSFFKDQSIPVSLLICLTIFLSVEIQLPLSGCFEKVRTQPAALLIIICEFLLLTYFIKTAVSSKLTNRIASFFILIIIINVQFGYYQTYRRFSSSEDLFAAYYSNIELYTNSFLLFFNSEALFITVFLAGSIFFLKSKTKKTKIGLFLPIFCMILFSFLKISLVSNQKFTIVSGLIDAGLETAFRVKSQVVRQKLEDLSIQNKPSKNLLLIIDESITADNLQINAYKRETTPFLNTLLKKNILHNWGTAVPGSTCSPLSNAMLITGSKAEKKAAELIHSRPTIFQYAKQYNYKTYYIDAQTEYLWIGLKTNDINQYVDHYLNINDFEKSIYIDHTIAKKLNQILFNSKGNFIVLNKKGVHYLYQKNYPKQGIKWKPIPNSNSKKTYLANKEFIENSYDNGIYFAVDQFFENLLPDQKVPSDTYIFYTSDHGQTLFKDNATWLHCNSTKREASVPLFLISNLDNIPQHNSLADHSNILPTILSVLEINYDKSIYSPSLLDQTEEKKKAYFLDGALNLHQYPENSLQ